MSNLTEKDKWFIRRIAESATRKEIASEMGLTVKAIDWRSVQVAKKIGLKWASDVAGITRFAVHNKMVEGK
jgi:hypothetical protein